MSERPSGTICTPDELAVSANSTTLRCFTRGETFGLLVSDESFLFSFWTLAQTSTFQLTTVASFTSLVAVCYVFSLILVCEFLMMKTSYGLNISFSVEHWPCLLRPQDTKARTAVVPHTNGRIDGALPNDLYKWENCH